MSRCFICGLLLLCKIEREVAQSYIHLATVMYAHAIIRAGHTFERSALASWLRRASTNPLTNAPIGPEAVADVAVLAALDVLRRSSTADRRGPGK